MATPPPPPRGIDPKGEEAQAGLKTYSRQKDLLSLPVPDLDQTLKKLVHSARAFDPTEEELRDFEKCVASFSQNEGRELQQQLRERAAGCRNWLEEWWVKYAYLVWPDPIQPQEGIAFRDLPEGSVMSRAARAGQTLTAALHYDHLLTSGKLEPIVLGEHPFCMHTFSRMYRSTRIPGEHMDTQLWYEGTRHLIVISHNIFYKVVVLDEANRIIPPHVLQSHIESIERDSAVRSRASHQPPLAAMTAWERPRWARARELLEKSAVNRDSLLMVDSSIVCVALDQGTPPDVVETLRSTMGPKTGVGLRWHDKATQWTFYKNGKVGASLEHSTGDGAPVTYCNEHIGLVIKGGGVQVVDPASLSSASFPQPQVLEWEITPELNVLINDADVYAMCMAQTLDAETVNFNLFGREHIKKAKISPDAYVQLAMQIAYMRTRGRIDAVYESVSLNRFYHGRTETCRSVSVDSVKFVKAMCNGKASDAEKASLLRAASDAHVRYCAEAAAGGGIDRHLIGLRILCMEAGKALPPLFSHPLYVKCSTYPMTSSQLNGPHASAAIGFRAVDKDGVGVQYQIYSDAMVLCVFTDFRCSETRSNRFLAELQRAMHEIAPLLVASRL